ncbi:MAG: hypothetical protein IMZ69_06925 [Spirochaetes bacterium]|nr:hypothetical protein [Spirochaetota bacterium]
MAKHFGGGAPWPWLETLGRRRLMRVYAVYERQAVEEEIVNEHLYPGKGREPKTLPSPRRMRVLVDERIAKRRAEEREEAEREA